ALTDELLRLLTIERYFHAVLGADAVRNRKPHAEHILETIRKAGGAQSSTVMVGDSLTDVEAARAADVPVIAVSFGYSTVPASELGADVLIDDFRELPRALKELS
ncbi:MAG: HAD-IA family hydrolase, partial [Alphaproteobacteria bacterium]|nr:HAD-IA family hydrolase [Alphaproteobacteria bacterium]